MATNCVNIELGDLEATCFVIMPFDPVYENEYRHVILPAIDASGLTCVRGDEIFEKPSIIDDIWKSLRSCRLVIAELTGKNPNVLYELGLAHSLGKPAIIITRNEADVPFDLKHLRYIFYDVNDPNWGVNLQQSLTKAIQNINESTSFSSHLGGITITGSMPLPTVDVLKKVEEKNIENIAGLWKTEIPGVDGAMLENTLHITQNQSELSATMVITYIWKDEITVVQEVLSGSIDSNKISLNGVAYTFIKRGNERAYHLDHLLLTLSDDGNTMRGKYADIRGPEAEALFKKVLSENT